MSGSLANIGWWRATGEVGMGGQNLDVLVEQLVADLNIGRSVALGFEAPSANCREGSDFVCRTSAVARTAKSSR